jgi:hypothetical protein
MMGPNLISTREALPMAISYIGLLRRAASCACGLMILAIAQPASAHCVLQDDDYASLRLSKSALSEQAQVDALDEFRQTLLCSTRDLWRTVHANGGHVVGAARPPRFSPIYLSPAELSIVNRAVDEWIGKYVLGLDKK